MWILTTGKMLQLLLQNCIHVSTRMCSNRNGAVTDSKQRFSTPWFKYVGHVQFENCFDTLDFIYRTYQMTFLQVLAQKIQRAKLTFLGLLLSFMQFMQAGRHWPSWKKIPLSSPPFESAPTFCQFDQLICHVLWRTTTLTLKYRGWVVNALFLI